MTSIQDLPAANYIRLDLFPADISGIDTEVSDKKVLVTDQHLLVIVQEPSGPSILIKEPLDEYFGRKKGEAHWSLTTESGTLVGITRASGCACGSRLRGINPYPGVPRIRG